MYVFLIESKIYIKSVSIRLNVIMKNKMYNVCNQI